MVKKLVSILLICSMLPLVFTSCSDKTESTVTDEVKVDTQRSVDKLDIVPGDVKFSGETFTVLSAFSKKDEDCFSELTYDATSGDYVDMAIYQRNKDVENRFGIKLKVVEMSGSTEVSEDFLASFRDSILSGNSNYDLIIGEQRYLADTALFDCYTDMNTVPYIKDDLESEYFYSEQIKNTGLNGKLYLLAGDYNLSCLENINVMYFNKKLAGEVDTQAIFTAVRNGTWTVDKCIEFAIGKYRDLNGDGNKGTSDRYGYVTDISGSTDAWFSSMNVQPTSRDNIGNPVLDIDKGKMVNILKKMNGFFTSKDVYTYNSEASDENSNICEQIFESNHALFFPSTLNRAIKYRRKLLDFGIVPLPKWDSSQENYYTQLKNTYSVAAIPSTSKDLKKSGAILDVLMAESRKTVRSAYLYELEDGKGTESNEIKEMLNIILDSVKFDFGYFYYDNLRIGRIISYLVENEIDYFVSYYAPNCRTYEKNLQNIIDAFDN